MFNTMENPSDMLAWLSQRNHHIPLEDLAFMLESKELNEYPEDLDAAHFTDSYYSE